MKTKKVKKLTHAAVSSLGGLGGGVKIALAGAGGSGSLMISRLVRMDLALRALGQRWLDVTVYDPDTVTESNVGRQMFYPGEVGLHKSVALVDRVNKGFGLGWSASTQAYTGQAAESEIGGRGEFTGKSAYDILITCIDKTEPRRQISQAWSGRDNLGLLMAPKYWLDLGNDQRSGQVVLGQFSNYPFGKQDKASPHLRHVVDMFPWLYSEGFAEDDQPSCSLAEALEKQDLLINDAVSVWASQLLYTLLKTGVVDCQGYWINLEDGVTRPIPILPYTPSKAVPVDDKNFDDQARTYPGFASHNRTAQTLVQVV